MTGSGMALALAGAVALTGCGTVKRLMSEVADAELRCPRCRAGMAIAVGAPVKIEVRWERCPSTDPGCHPDEPPFAITVACDGVPCEVQDDGGGYFEVTPTAAGTATVVVTLADQRTRIERLGPVTVATLDGIAIRCTTLAPGAGPTARRPCGDGIAAGSEIELDIAATAGERWLANPVPRDVAVDGRLIYEAGQMVGDAEWSCRASEDSPDPNVPTITRCRAVARRGGRWSVEARLPDHRLGARLPVTVAK